MGVKKRKQNPAISPDQGREEADAAIQQGILKKCKILDLSGLNLSALPAGIEEIKTLRRLYLQDNPLDSIPKPLLNLPENCSIILDDVPCAEPFLRARMNHLGRSRLEEEGLTVWCEEKNGGPEYPQRIEAANRIIKYLGTENQKILELNGLNLTSLPPIFEKITDLKELSLANNQLESLPREIGQLRNLTILHLMDNPFTSLPKELFDLPPHCNVLFTFECLPAELLNEIQTIISTDGYRGAHIHERIYSLVPEVDRSLDGLLNEIYQLAGKELPLFNKLQMNETLKTWLNTLRYLANSQDGKRTRKELAPHIASYLELAESSDTYRKLFIHTLDKATEVREDQKACSLISLALMAKLLDKNEDLSDMEVLANLLIQSIWPTDQLKKIAHEKAQSLHLSDAIEVYLGYVMKLKRELKLPLDLLETLYFKCDLQSDSDLREVYQQIVDNCNDFEKQCMYLSNSSLWKAALKKNYPADYERALKSKDPKASLFALTNKINNHPVSFLT